MHAHTQVTQLRPSHLTSGTSSENHITCVRFSAQGELLATYNYEVRATACHGACQKPPWQSNRGLVAEVGEEEFLA